MNKGKPPKRAGRPKDPLLERRILKVTLAHLREQGFARMSIDQIAAAAGVGKPAIYRRWKRKADLAAAALLQRQISEPEIPDQSTPGRLCGVTENLRRSLLRPHGMALMGTVLAEEAHTPELLRLFREGVVSPRRRMLRRILSEAKARGELRANAAIEPAIAMLLGAVYAQYLAESRVSAAFAKKAAEAVWISVRK
jgi:AcrR family transcriptional regulator